VAHHQPLRRCLGGGNLAQVRRARRHQRGHHHQHLRIARNRTPRSGRHQSRQRRGQPAPVGADDLPGQAGRCIGPLQPGHARRGAQHIDGAK